ncbi:hypothetical protein [Dysgonomonas sp. GY617]|uniref:hypothetical protein n=1 Tax=Dysgonomonas sp. GY617 TaxID=2780420 RepID=UPI0018837496|nr:hypothetical protein [Dysgonomonas sp. GY617]MBF0576597.1 hypothetical protein [Dysgonomonas sp. GY617]
MKDRGFLLDKETGDFDIRVTRDSVGMITGGLTIGDVTEQNQRNIIFINPAEIKEAPTVGVGIESMLNSDETLLYKHKIREQLEADGQRVSYLNIKITSDNKIDIPINAKY